MTRPATQAGRLVAGLRDLGAEPLACPAIRIEEPADPSPLYRAAERVDEYDWVVFTSVNGVASFWRALGDVGRTARLPAGVRVAAIGPATAAALEERGKRPEIVPAEHVAEAVADALIELNGMKGRRVLLPRAAAARSVLPERLRAAGARVDQVVAYETRPDAEGISALRAGIDRDGVDMITFAAASAVRYFAELAGPDVGRARVAVIGPITAAAARAVGVRVDAEAADYTVPGLIRAICEYFARRGERS